MISYDTNVLIYALEGHPEFGTASQKIVLLGESQGAVLSVLAKHELYTGVVLGAGDASGTMSAFGSLTNMRLIDATEDVVDIAVELTVKYGKKCRGYDALILATAISSGAQTYYTNDKNLLRAGIEEIVVVGLL